MSISNHEPLIACLVIGPFVALALVYLVTDWRTVPEGDAR